MPDPRIQARVDEEVVVAIEDYVDREQTNKSTAVRQFVLAGMDRMDEAPEDAGVPESATDPEPRQPTTRQLADRVAVGNRVAGVMLVLVLACGALVTSVGVLPEFLFGLAQVALVVGLCAVVSSWYYIGQLAVDAGLVARVATLFRARVDADDLADTAGGAD